jgi:uncharacterized membrane protein (UPF0127 family)
MSFFLILAAVTHAVFLAGSPDTVTIKGHTFSAEISKTVEQKVKGLMFRKELPDNSCMVFLYTEDSNRPIWMENTKIPLDVIWVSESGRVVEALENIPPCPVVYNPGMCPEFGGEVPSRHFIEFPAGTIAKIGIKYGDNVVLNLLDPHDYQ